MWALENLEPGLEGLSMAIFTRVLEWSKQETDTFLTSVRKDMRDTKIHSYWQMYAPDLSMLSHADTPADITSLDKSRCSVSEHLEKVRAKLHLSFTSNDRARLRLLLCLLTIARVIQQ
jgi:hypothetical protein